MPRKSIAMLVVLIWHLSTATVVSAGTVKLSGVFIYLGPPSLIADGMLAGLGQQDVNVMLDASGIPTITCISPGGNEVPGQSYPKVSAVGQVFLSGNDAVRKNGRSPFSVETVTPGPQTGETAVQLGCPNANSAARIDFVFWTNATIRVVDAKAGTVLVSQDYICTTTRYPASVACVSIP